MTNDEYKAALRRIETIFSAERGTPEGDELERLIRQVGEHEDVHFPMAEVYLPTPRTHCGHCLAKLVVDSLSEMYGVYCPNEDCP